MKLLKKITLTLLIILVVGFFFKGIVFRTLFTYNSIGQRENYSATDTQLCNYIDGFINGEEKLTSEEIINLSLKITSKQLHFTSQKNQNDPNKLIESKSAHCVGYAAFFATTCNYLFKKYNLSNEFYAQAQIGNLYLFGINLHKFTNSTFFKDHDFVLITNQHSNETIAVDPTIHDYFGINSITFAK